MKPARTILDLAATTSLLALTFALAGCSEPLPSEFEAKCVVGLTAGSNSVLAGADFTADSSRHLPDLSEGATLTVNGAVLPAKGVVDRPGNPVETFEFLGSAPLAEPGGDYTFVLDLPWAKGSTVSLPAFAGVDFLSPLPSAKVPFHEGLDVHWSGVEAGIEDTLDLTLLPAVSRVDSERVAAGETSFHLSAKVLQKAFERAGPGVESVEVELTLNRVRFVSSHPPFAGGNSRIEGIVARIPLTLVP